MKGFKMSDFLKSQQEAKLNLIAQVRDILEGAESEKRGLTVEDLTRIERLEADIESRDASISTAKKYEERASAVSEAGRGFEVAQPATDVNALLRSIARGESRGHEFAAEKRTLVGSSNTVPQSFYNQVFQVARLAGPMLTVADVINTASGETLTLPTLTARSTATIKGAGTAIAESEPTFSSIALNAFKYSFLVPVANELITDAGFDISSLIAEQAGNAIGFAVNTDLTVGTGTVLPKGIVSAATTTGTGATSVSGAPSYEDLVNLVYSIDGQARLSPTGLGFMASKTGIAAIRKVKDSAGHYIFNEGGAQPPGILGYNLYENPAVAAVGLGALSVGFGDLKSYKARVAGGLKIATSTDYGFNTDVTYFRVQMRADGNLTHASHFAMFKGGAS
jgi:HK97 family phage major capsid protein